MRYPGGEEIARDQKADRGKHANWPTGREVENGQFRALRKEQRGQHEWRFGNQTSTDPERSGLGAEGQLLAHV